MVWCLHHTLKQQGSGVLFFFCHRIHSLPYIKLLKSYSIEHCNFWLTDMQAVGVGHWTTLPQYNLWEKALNPVLSCLSIKHRPRGAEMKLLGKLMHLKFYSLPGFIGALGNSLSFTSGFYSGSLSSVFISSPAIALHSSCVLLKYRGKGKKSRGKISQNTWWFLHGFCSLCWWRLHGCLCFSEHLPG